jgi:gliding motility-associated-like protein
MVVRASPQVVMPRDTAIVRGQSVRLSPEVVGAVTGYAWAPPAGLSGVSIVDPLATPLSTTTYALLVTSGNGCDVTGKVTIDVYTRLAMPGAFTPNGDGRNDVFRIPPSVSVQLRQFSVFDRHGQRVFVTANLSEGWDGTVGGKKASAGAYVWVVEYVDFVTGRDRVEEGTVVLVR